jgi:hypothetical protein
MAQGFRPSAHHGENGSLLRLGHRLVGMMHRNLGGIRKLLQAEGVLAPDRFGKPVQKLGKNHPGVAVCILHGSPGNGIHGVSHTQLTPRLGDDGAQGQCQVGAGIAVGNGKHIDAVEVSLIEDDIARAGDHEIVQARAIQITGTGRIGTAFRCIATSITGEIVCCSTCFYQTGQILKQHTAILFYAIQAVAPSAARFPRAQDPLQMKFRMTPSRNYSRAFLPLPITSGCVTTLCSGLDELMEVASAFFFFLTSFLMSRFAMAIAAFPMGASAP